MKDAAGGERTTLRVSRWIFLKDPPPRHLSVVQLSIIQRRSHYCNKGRVAEILCNKAYVAKIFSGIVDIVKKIITILATSVLLQKPNCNTHNVAKIFVIFLLSSFFRNMVVVVEGNFATLVTLQKERHEGYVYTRHMVEAADRSRAIHRVKARVSRGEKVSQQRGKELLALIV